jgi:hypothetical protein
MKITATPLAFAALKIERWHDWWRNPLQYLWFEAARAVWQPIAGAVRNEAKIVGFDVWPVRQRCFVDIENEGGLVHLASASLNINTRGSENRGDIAVVVSIMVGEHQLLEFVDV